MYFVHPDVSRAGNRVICKVLIWCPDTYNGCSVRINIQSHSRCHWTESTLAYQYSRFGPQLLYSPVADRDRE
jgi:hypothetical protein